MASEKKIIKQLEQYPNVHDFVKDVSPEKIVLWSTRTMYNETGKFISR
jgi:hypothetical protein